MRKASGIWAVEIVSARFVEAAHTESRLPRINTPHAKGGFWPEYVHAAIVYTEQLREGLITGMLAGGGGVRLNGRSEHHEPDLSVLKRAFLKAVASHLLDRRAVMLKYVRARIRL